MRGFYLRLFSKVKCAVLLFAASVTCLVQADPVYAQDSKKIALVYQARKSHQEVAQQVMANLRVSGYSCSPFVLYHPQRAISDDELAFRLRKENPVLILSAGEHATLCSLRAIPEVPVLFFLIPNALDKSFVQAESPYRARVGGITTDISPEIYFSWFADVFPDITQLGVLHSARTSRTAVALLNAANHLGITARPIHASKDDFANAIDRLERLKCEGAIMLPDSSVYNPASVQRLLLWGLRKHKPVWGFSSKIVKAGALAGPVVSREHAAEEVTKLAMEILAGRDIGTIGVHYSKPSGYAVNDRTATMIGAVLSRARIPQGTLRFGEER